MGFTGVNVRLSAQINSKSNTVKKAAIPIAHHKNAALDSIISEQGRSTLRSPQNVLYFCGIISTVSYAYYI